jgi:hypothetical protein
MWLSMEYKGESESFSLYLGSNQAFQRIFIKKRKGILQGSCVRPSHSP